MKLYLGVEVKQLPTLSNLDPYLSWLTHSSTDYCVILIKSIHPYHNNWNDAWTHCDQ